MNDRVWVNPRQPQTLYLAQVLMYLQGGMDLLFGLFFGVAVGSIFGSRSLGAAYLLLVVIGKILAANGIANEQKWGHGLGTAAAVAPLAIRLLLVLDVGLSSLFFNPIRLMFDIALVALLLHEQSREYVKIWFK
ncbi:MAG: hypothetical protein ACE5GB_07365 [Acidimicrobiales bacterium]